MKLSNVLLNLFSIDIDHLSIVIDFVIILSPSPNSGAAVLSSCVVLLQDNRALNSHYFEFNIFCQLATSPDLSSDFLTSPSLSSDSSDASTCMLSEWITWSPCSASCGIGSRSRERYVKQFPDDGSVCTLPTEETETCVVNEECCEFSLLLFKSYYGFNVSSIMVYGIFVFPTCPKLPAVAWLQSGGNGTSAVPLAVLA